MHDSSTAPSDAIARRRFAPTRFVSAIRSGPCAQAAIVVGVALVMSACSGTSADRSAPAGEAEVATWRSFALVTRIRTNGSLVDGTVVSEIDATEIIELVRTGEYEDRPTAAIPVTYVPSLQVMLTPSARSSLDSALAMLDEQSLVIQAVADGDVLSEVVAPPNPPGLGAAGRPLTIGPPTGSSREDGRAFLRRVSEWFERVHGVQTTGR